jgi:glutathione S-transferase
MIKLYSTGNRLYPNNLKILLTLAEADASHEYVVVDFSKGEHRQPSFLAINPHGKTPAFTDGEVKLGESNAIMWYIAEKFPAAKLLPEDAGGRAQVLQYCDFSATYLIANIYDLANHTISWSPADRSADIAERARVGLERALGVLDSVLAGGEYVTGRFSIADLACAASIRYLLERLPQYAELKPATQRWYQRMTERKAWKQVALGS